MTTYVPEEAIEKYYEDPDINPKDLIGITNMYGEPASPRTARRWHQALRNGEADSGGESVFDDLPEGEIKTVETDHMVTVACKSEHIQKFEDLIKLSGIDTQLWKVDKQEIRTSQVARKDQSKDLHFNNGKVSGYIVDDGEFTTATLFHLQIKFVRREEAPFEQVLDRILERLHTPREYVPAKPSYPKGDYLLVPGMSDIHFARLSLDGTYTPEQTRKDLDRAGDAMIARVLGMGMPVSQILLPVGNDLLNADNLSGSTTRGTWQLMSADIRDAIDAVCQGYTELIEKLVRVAPVRVVLVPGNHDRYSIYWLGKYLEAYFKYHPYAEYVVVDNAKSERKYFKFGKNVIGMEHGDKVPAKELALIMAQESGCFDTTKYRTFLRGHFHKEKGMITPIADTGAVHVITYPAFCPPDSWELMMGYLGGNRAAEARFFHKEQGPAGVFPIFIDELD